LIRVDSVEKSSRLGIVLGVYVVVGNFFRG
jgi:hypothetical protein